MRENLQPVGCAGKLATYCKRGKISNRWQERENFQSMARAGKLPTDGKRGKRLKNVWETREKMKRLLALSNTKDNVLENTTLLFLVILNKLITV